MMKGYREDLAYIHDVGFGDYARNAAPGLLRILARHGVRDGFVVDLGCGSGIWARQLTDAGYGVLGVDISPFMIELAQKRAPLAAFRTGSLLKARLPECAAVTSLGECINYVFDGKHSKADRLRFFARVWRALRPGGIFIFDFAEPSRAPEVARRSWREGKDWAILVKSSGSAKPREFSRRIICFRRVGNRWRRSQETHRLQLYERAGLATEIQSIGFEVEELTSYGRFPLLPGTAALLARRA